MTFAVGDIVEIIDDNSYWKGARGPVVSVGRYVRADLVTAPTAKYGDGESAANILRFAAGFPAESYRLIDDSKSFVPEVWS
jgi:hypothetical protein